MSVRLDWRGRAVGRKFKRAIIGGVDDATGLAARFSQRFAPYWRGFLRRSIRNYPAYREGGKTTGWFGSDLPYAAVQERRYRYLLMGANAAFPAVFDFIKRRWKTGL